MQMVKRIFKMIGLSLGIFVATLGIAVGIFAISGGFKDEEIDILKLYVANEQNNVNMNKEDIYTLSDITRTIMCEPADATNRVLEVDVNDPLVPKDEEYTSGILKNPPKEIIAGEPFKLEINKDANGNNIGGVVNLTISPKGKKGITDVTLKVIVDTAIPNNSIYFANNTNDSFTTSGKNVVMAQSSHEQNIYLRSNLVNAFSLEVADKTTITNLKNVNFSYTYFDVNNVEIDKQSINNAKLESKFDNNLKLYNYFYKVPLVLNKPGHVEVVAKMHKTSSMEKDYIVGDFDNMIIPTSNSSQDIKDKAEDKLEAYNAFLNKYKEFIDTSKESNEFFRKRIEVSPKTGLPEIALNYSDIAESKKYVFQTTSFTINITTVNLKNLYSTNEAKEYKVLSTKRFTIDDLKNEFNLIPTLAGDDGHEIENIPAAELKTLFDTLKVTPYIYVEKETYNQNADIWADYNEVMGVLSFTNNKPTVVTLKKSEIDGFDGQGILVKLVKDHNGYSDYITVTPSPDSSNKYWDISFNVPMKNDEKSFADTKRALFLQFEVTGLDLNTLKPIVAKTYSRVFIEYTEYAFKVGVDNLTFLNTFKTMAINSDLDNASQKYPSKPYEQSISLNLKENLTNYDQVEYKRVMYFVEETSNVQDGYPKVLSVGKYRFKTMQGNPLKAAVPNDAGGYDEIDLIGERLLYTGSFDNPNYFIHAINASTTPIRVFAVVYLSDANGNPIDLNGRKIVIDERETGDPFELVVFDITDITSNEEIHIDSYVNNLNYYTYSKVDKTIAYQYQVDGEEKEVQYQASVGDLIKRNQMPTYTTPDGQFDDAHNTELANFLRLKLLANNYLDVLVTNFELDNTGAQIDEEKIYSPIFAIKDFYGKTNLDAIFKINTLNNKQIAFNMFCEEFNDTNYTVNGFSEYKSNIIMAEEVPTFIQLRLLHDGEEISGGVAVPNELRIMANTNVTSPITNALNDVDYVNWTVSNLEVSEVNLLDVESYYKLYVRSSADAKKHFDFVETKLNGAARTFKDHVLFNGDNVIYDIVTNLYTDGELNLDVIDASQAVFAGEPSDGEEQLGIFEYPDISTYIQAYCHQKTSISYLTCDSSIILTSNLTFKSKGIEIDGHEYIYVGANKYVVTGNQVYINGKSYVLSTNQEGDHELTIVAGNYFPVVNNSENGIAIVLGEELVIEKVDGQESYLIYNCDSQENIRATATVEFKYKLGDYNNNYSSHNYIYDGSKDNSDTNSAIVIDEKSGDATVNFLKGGTIRYVYVEDIHGLYKKVGDNYEVAGDEYVGQRYDKKGIQTFLMITFDGDVYKKPITKVITYELIQEDINIVAKNSDGTINAENNPMMVLSGTDNVIQIANGGNNSINIASPIDRLSFFKHVQFEIQGQGDVYFKSIVGGDTTQIIYNYDANNPDKYNYEAYIESGFTLSIPDTYRANGQFTVTLTYSWIDENNNIREQSKVIYFVIQNNFDFKVNDDAVNDNLLGGITSSENYTLDLKANSSTNLDDILKYFTVGENTAISLEIDSQYGNANYAKIEDGEIVIGNSYGLYDGENINLDKFRLIIKLTKEGKTITVDKGIVVGVIPDYVIDLTTISKSTNNNPEAILNGDSLYNYNYLRLYKFENTDSLGDLVTDSSKYSEIFALTSGDGGTTYANGIVRSTNMLECNKLELKLTYVEGLEDTEIAQRFYLNLLSYNLGYAASGDKDYVNNQQTNTTFAIYVQNGAKLDMTNFFQVSLGNGVDSKYSNLYSNLFMVLSDGTNIYQSSEVVEGQFKLYIASFDGKDYHLITEWGTNSVQVYRVNLFYSIEGTFNNSTSFGTMDVEFILNKNQEISAPQGTVITVSNYFRFYDKNGSDSEISVLFKNENGQTNNLIVGLDDVTYSICYKINNTVYDSGYTITLKNSNLGA